MSRSPAALHFLCLAALAACSMAQSAPPEFPPADWPCHVRYSITPGAPTHVAVQDSAPPLAGTMSAEGPWEYSCDGRWRRVQGTPKTFDDSPSQAGAGQAAAFSLSTNGSLCLVRTADLETGTLSDIVHVHDLARGDGIPGWSDYAFDKLAFGVAGTDESARLLTLHDVARMGTRTDLPNGGSRWSYANALGWTVEVTTGPDGLLAASKSVFAPTPGASVEWTTTISETRVVEGRQVPWRFRRVKSAGGGRIILEDLSVEVESIDTSSRSLAEFPPVPPEEPIMKESAAGRPGATERPGWTAADYDRRQ